MNRYPFPPFFCKPVPCAVIGCGHIFRTTYAPSLNNFFSPVICRALYSRSPQSAQAARKVLKSKPLVCQTPEDLSPLPIRAVIITSPNDSHQSYITAAVKAGMDVLCEKPAANTFQETIELKNLLDKSPRTLMLAFNRRYLKSIQALKGLLDKSAIGQIREIHACHSQNIPGHVLNSDWLSDSRKSGGGVLHNAGIHLVNLLISLFGKVEHITAIFENRVLPASAGEDTARCEMLFNGGIPCRIDASWASAAPSHYEQIVVDGEKGSLTWSLFPNDLILKNDSSRVQHFIFHESLADSVYNELKHFSQCVRTRETPQTGIADSLETIRVVEAARDSARSGRTTYLSDH